MAQHNDLGKKGEAQARAYLQSKAYTIKVCNWLSGKGELDIVAEKDNMLIVVEVKSRSTATFEHPKDAITPAKIRRIVETTHDYIMANSIDLETRFDVISVIAKGDKYEIEHIEDAFLPPSR